MIPISEPATFAHVTCPRCGHERQISRAQALAGTWRRCPVCQPLQECPAAQRDVDAESANAARELQAGSAASRDTCARGAL